jgi:GTPase SAR1 family protein
MTLTDPSQILAQANLWAAELRACGQVDDATADHLGDVMAVSRGEGLDHQNDALTVVMLCGPTAVGKSSLINALAGSDVSPEGLGATTRAAVLYVHERDDPTRLIEYTQVVGCSDGQEAALVRHCRDELLHKVLVDTPDLDSVRLQHRELTTRLVHAADLILFVTSPEKYKVMRSARWILEQRQQRAIAFVINKWDREALGLHQNRRGELEQDFRGVLTDNGFPGALIFRVSALKETCGGQAPAGIENELPALRAWLEEGISQSTAGMIRQRRLRAAWGRLAAAIEPVVPRTLSDHPLLHTIIERLVSSGDAVEQSVAAEASILAPVGLEDVGWPATPGLLGMWTRTRRRVASSTASLRAGLSMLNGAGLAGIQEARSILPMPESAFGARSTATLSEMTAQIGSDATVARIALGAVSSSWIAEVLQLEHQLALLPLDVTTELVADAGRPTLRRLTGIASIYATEGLIVLVLLIAIGRTGLDFVAGTYAPVGLFFTALELISSLVILGHIAGNAFFPPLRQRLRRVVAQRARSLVKAAMERAKTILMEHVETVERLAREGCELLYLIDHTMVLFTTESGDQADINHLFGQPPPQQGLDQETPAPERG